MSRYTRYNRRLEDKMYFQGIFFSVICFSVVIVCEPFISRAESLFSRRIWPLLLCAGLMLFLISLFI